MTRLVACGALADSGFDSLTSRRASVNLNSGRLQGQRLSAARKEPLREGEFGIPAMLMRITPVVLVLRRHWRSMTTLKLPFVPVPPCVTSDAMHHDKGTKCRKCSHHHCRVCRRCVRCDR